MLELSGGVGSLPQAPRWNADRRARPSLPLPVRGGGREIRRAAASQMRTEGLRVCRRFAFLIFFEPGAIEMEPVPPPAAVRRGSGWASVLLGAKLGRRRAARTLPFHPPLMERVALRRSAG